MQRHRKIVFRGSNLSFPLMTMFSSETMADSRGIFRSPVKHPVGDDRQRLVCMPAFADEDLS